MAAARCVLSQQHDTGLQDEMFLFAGDEIERPAQRDHKLARRRGMPLESAATIGFLQ